MRKSPSCSSGGAAAAAGAAGGRRPSDSSARAICSIIAMAGNTSRISSASSGWRSMYSFSGGPLAPAVALEELLGQFQHEPRSRFRTVHPALLIPTSRSALEPFGDKV